MQRSLRSMLLVGAIAAALPVACTAQSPAGTPIAPPPSAVPAAPLVAGLPDFTRLVERVGPAVVNISAEIAPRRSARQQMPGGEEIPEFFRRFFGDEMPFPGMPQGPQGPRGGMSLGTGFLISADGYLMTNHHVVDGASRVKVRLSDRREFEARVIGSDEQSDVALLKIDGSGLPYLRSGNASGVKAGQWVVAIGSPFGLEQSVTAGVVSATGRANPLANQQYVPFIQTDVAINRGNSGGPLLNTSGEVIGINSQIFSNSGGYMGVSFAIPIDVAMNAAEQLRSSGRVSRGLLGVGVENVTSDVARELGLPDTNGALVNNVSAGSGAARAGIQVFDVIRAVDGRPVMESSDLPPLVGARAPGSKVRVTLVRDGRQRDIEVTLGALEAVASAGGGAQGPGMPEAPASAAGANALGIGVRDANAAERQRMGLAAGEGVVVSDPGDAGRDAGIARGDVVLRVGRTPVGSAAAFDRAVSGTAPGQARILLVRRGQATQVLTVTAPER
mgnify:CR=1 FL=1